MGAVADDFAFRTQDGVLQSNRVDTPEHLRSTLHTGTLHHRTSPRELNVINLLSLLSIREPTTTGPIKLHLPIHDVGDVPPVTQELHDLLAVASKLRPVRTRVRVLLQASQHLPFKPEVDLMQSGLAGPSHWVGSVLKRDGRGVLDQRLAPYGNQGFF